MQTVLFVAAEGVMADVPDAKLPALPAVYKWARLAYADALTFEALSEAWHQQDPEPAAVVTYGDKSAWRALGVCYQTRRRWLHFDAGALPPALDSITATIMGAVYPPGPPGRPLLLSAFTTTFHSGDLLARPHRSLLAQTHRDWEWVVWDDSKPGDGGATYARLLELAKKDLRIRVFKAPAHSGSIGAMKRLAAGVALGDILVELDHDDDLHPDLFAWIAGAAVAHPAADFFFTDTARLHEGTLAPISYGDFFAFGYSGHYMTWSPVHNRFLVSATNPPPNPTTIRHIVGVPNHVRAWRTTAYDRVGKHNPLLSVADDYDLIVRTYLDRGRGGGEGIEAEGLPPGSTWCHIRGCGYYQYNNRASHGNFTYIRNALIQRDVAAIRAHFEPDLPPTLPGAAKVPLWKRIDGAGAGSTSTSTSTAAGLYTDYPQTHAVYDPEGPWRGPPVVCIRPVSAAEVVAKLPPVYDSALQVIIMGVPVDKFEAFVDGTWCGTGGETPAASTGPTGPNGPIPPKWRRNICGWALTPASTTGVPEPLLDKYLAHYAAVYLDWSS